MIKLTMISRLCRYIACCTLLFLTAESASAATVRGQLNRRDGTRTSPAAGVCVTVYKSGGARSPRTCSDSNGIYYLQGIAAGEYQLEVWSSPSPGTPPERYPIVVSEPNTDVRPITIP